MGTPCYHHLLHPEVHARSRKTTGDQASPLASTLPAAGALFLPVFRDVLGGRRSPRRGMSSGGRTRRCTVLSPEDLAQHGGGGGQDEAGTECCGRPRARGLPRLAGSFVLRHRKAGASSVCICSSPQKLPLLSYFCYFSEDILALSTFPPVAMAAVTGVIYREKNTKINE